MPLTRTQVSVLVSNISSAHLIASVADGKMLYSFAMTLRNTQAQFLRVALPTDASVWSTSVQSM
jgi:hypothetical protein